MAFNPTTASAQNNKRIDNAQGRIANLQGEYLKSVAGDPGARDQDALRQAMFAIQAVLASIRQFAQWIVQEQKQGLEANKNSLELAKI